MESSGAHTCNSAGVSSLSPSPTTVVSGVHSTLFHCLPSVTREASLCGEGGEAAAGPDPAAVCVREARADGAQVADLAGEGAGCSEDTAGERQAVGLVNQMEWLTDLPSSLPRAVRWTLHLDGLHRDWSL